MWIAIVMRARVDIETYCLFKTRTEADSCGVHESSPTELDPDDDPDHWQKYDPVCGLITLTSLCARTSPSALTLRRAVIILLRLFVEFLA
jgi:hypothetical protein